MKIDVNVNNAWALKCRDRLSIKHIEGQACVVCGKRVIEHAGNISDAQKKAQAWLRVRSIIAHMPAQDERERA